MFTAEARPGKIIGVLTIHQTSKNKGSDVRSRASKIANNKQRYNCISLERRANKGNGEILLCSTVAPLYFNGWIKLKGKEMERLRSELRGVSKFEENALWTTICH